MFRRPTAEQLRRQNLSDRFGVVFILSLVVTFVTFPVLIGGLEASGALGLVFVFGLPLLFSILLPAVIVSAVKMAVVYRVCETRLPAAIAFVIGSSVAAFVGVVLACHLDFSWQQPYVALVNEPINLQFSTTLGAWAAMVSGVIALFFCRDGDAS
ncbi:MAG: hypothetical protein ABJ320_19065 [Lentilitoribacter sp.]|uniref:hypothetical protein n=1 Tax=Tateyamaria sp. TaxID=1929288 RepID=UPI00328234C9